jgi:Na+-transporting NADH:ubiquinone oxidoreductase subunit NqrB
MPIMHEEIEHLFTYHDTKPGQVERYVAIRDAAKLFAYTVVRNTPPSADQSAAVRHIRDAVADANAAIALEKGPTT